MNGETAKRYFCTVPFERLEVHGGGECWACCPGWLRRKLGTLSADTPLEAIWNGEAARDIRAGILDGSFRDCDETRCPHLAAKTGHVVEREAARRDERLRAIIDENRAVLADGPLNVHASYDQSCNLSCPSCRTQTIVASGQRLTSILDIQRRFADEILPSARWLYITGTGDPFAAASFRDLLRGMDPARYPHLEAIHVHTNGLLWTPENWARLEKIHHLIRSAEISVDAATHETYRENRRGGDFSVLLENLTFISGLDLKVTLSFVVQANNYREMPAFVELGRERLGFSVYFAKLFNWGTYSDEDYRRRAVHEPEHPEHLEFLEVLRQPVLASSGVRIGNLTSLRTSVDTPATSGDGGASGRTATETAPPRRLPVV